MTHFAISARLAPSLIALPLFTLAAHAQTCPQPVELNLDPLPFGAEIENQKASLLDGQSHSLVSNFAGTYFLSATTLSTGRELYRTNGTLAGTQLVADINPFGDSNPRELVGAPGRVYFFADDGVHGRELWTSDGTMPGTVMLLDANPGAANGSYTDLAVLGGKAYFGATGPVGGMELWSTDGTPGGTALLVDLNPNGASWPLSFRRAPGGTELYFRANHPTLGDELWKTDGTVVGTVFLKNIHPIAGVGSGIKNFVSAGGLTFFDAASSGSGRELWVTDGTTAGTQQLGVFTGGGVYDELDLEYAIDWNGKLVFTAFTPASGLEVWTSDGTPAGTQLLVDVYPGAPFSFPFAYALVGNQLVFAAESAGTGTELWRADAAGNLTQLTDIQPGTMDSFNAVFQGFQKMGAVLLFAAGPVGNKELWITDGTVAGTTQFLDLDLSGSSEPRDLTAIGAGALLLSADTADFGRELMVVTAAATKQVLEIEPTVASPGANPDDVVAIGNQRVFLSAEVGGAGREPVLYEPGVGYTLLGDLEPGSWPSNPAEFTRFGVGSAERILFVAETQAFGRELWISDGGATAPQLVADLFPGPIGSGPRDLIELDGRVLFVAHSQTLGYEVWSTDGTAAGTNVLADIWPGIGSSEPYDFIRWGDKVVFTTFPGGDSRLWVTDGTPAGTKVLGAAFGLTEQQNPFVVGDKLYFAAASPGFGRELWVTDGTAPNTMQLADAWPGINDSEPVGLGAIGDTLLFYARAGHFDRSLWVTNGTPAGTMEIADINVWPSVVPGSAAVSDGILYFRAEDSLGFELWRSDGTPAGTNRLTDLRAGSFGSYPNSFVAVAGGVFFVADSDTWGVELFRSDGTVAGTGIACDVNPGPESAAPSDLVWVDGQLAFAATTPLTGRELFVGNLGRAHVAVLDSAGMFALNSTSPVLGASVTLKASGVRPGLVSVLAWSLPVTTPSDVLMLPGSANWLDLGNAQLAGVFAASAWSTSVTLPSAAGLVGLVINVQAFELPGASLPAHASNGLALTLGF